MGDPSPLSSSDYPKGNTGDPVFELNSRNAKCWIPRKFSELRRMTIHNAKYWIPRKFSELRRMTMHNARILDPLNSNR